LTKAPQVRTHLVTAADGTVYASGGVHVGQVFRVSRDGTVEALASDLADPEGIAVDGRGAVLCRGVVASSDRASAVAVRKW